MLVHNSCKPLNVAYSLEPGTKFEPEGRVILAEVRSAAYRNGRGTRLHVSANTGPILTSWAFGVSVFEVDCGQRKECQSLQFGTFRLLNTYSVNNGWTAPSFARRKQWDSVVATFIAKARDHPKPLVYVGDLNCSPTGVMQS
jgi:exonuclease III